jgi:hypothetical protein
MNDNNKQGPPNARVVLKLVRLAYADQLIVPKAFAPGQPERFSATLLMPPGHPGPELVDAALIAMATERWGPRAKWPRQLRGIMRDPVVKDVAEYPKIGSFPRGWSFVRVGSLEPPGIVMPNLAVVSKADYRSEIYSGRWALAVSANAYAYEQQTGAGVTLGLNNIQLGKHDTRLGSGRPRPEDDFDASDLDPDNGDDDASDNDNEDDDFVRPSRRQ